MLGDKNIIEREILTGLLMKEAEWDKHDFASSGYQKLPSGLIIQWGVTRSSGTRTYATFPIAFPNAVLSLTYSERSRQDWNTYIVSLSNTGFTAGVDGGGGMPSVFYIVIGY